MVTLLFMRQNVMFVWQSEVQTTLIRTSYASGGATSTSSISSGSPAALHTAAASDDERRGFQRLQS
jgi:hypothetical protein